MGVISKSKKKGGLGVKDISKIIGLLCKWWWRSEKESSLWQDLVKAKYLRGKVVGSVNHGLDVTGSGTRGP